MECVEAQAIISEALDRAATDAALLTEAKQHCRECPECTRFVRGMMLVKSAPLPDEPTGLADSVVASVRAEAEATRLAAEAAAAEAARAAAAAEHADLAATASPDSAGVESPGSAGDAPKQTVELAAARHRETRRLTISVWSAAAAVFIIVVGVVAVSGVRMMSTAPETREAGLAGKTSDMATQESGVVGDSAIAPAVPDVTATAAGAPDFIVVNALVYRLAGPVSPAAVVQRRQAGSTDSDLGGESTRPHAVYAVPGQTQVYVDGIDGQVLGFDPVTRVYLGRSYQLNSGPIPTFGAWPMLPESIEAPQAADGSPTFKPAGPDESGLFVYLKASGTAADGIAVAPDAPQDDPMAGNPNWTWWTPLN